MKSLMEVNISLEIIRQTFQTHKHEKKKRIFPRVSWGIKIPQA